MKKRFKILSKIKYLRIKNWFLKLRRDGIRKRFLQELIPLVLPKHHLAGNSKGGGRRKKVEAIDIGRGSMDC